MKVIVLAAGCAQRMGQAKQLLQWQGQTMLQHCLDKLYQNELEITLVIGAYAKQIRASLDKQYNIVENPHWASGMGSSIAAGMSSLNQDDSAVLLILADQPAITGADIKQLMTTWSKQPEQICCSSFEQLIAPNTLQKVLSVPAIFPKKYFSELSSLCKKVGAKSILNRELENLTQVLMPNSQININTTDDWNHWLQQLATPQQILEDTKNEIYTE